MESSGVVKALLSIARGFAAVTSRIHCTALDAVSWWRTETQRLITDEAKAFVPTSHSLHFITHDHAVSNKPYNRNISRTA